MWIVWTSCHCDHHFSSYTALDLFPVPLKYNNTLFVHKWDSCAHTKQINYTTNVIQAEIHNEPPTRDLHTSEIFGWPKNTKTPASTSLQKYMSGLRSWIRSHHTAWSANESWSEDLSANHSCYLPPFPICKLQAVIVMSSTSKTLQYVMSTHLTHTETLYMRGFETQINFDHYYATQIYISTIISNNVFSVSDFTWVLELRVI